MNDAENQLATKQGIATPLTEASTSANKALELLPTEKELAALAQKLKARTSVITKEVKAAQKAVADKTPAVKTTTEALAASRKGADAIKVRFDKARVDVRQLETQLTPAQSGYVVTRVKQLM